jgi:peptide/nickel transport system ATP-binding protein
MLPYRKKIQMIFQDPYASLNPRMTVKKMLEEPVIFHNKSIRSAEVVDKVAEVMQQVGVDPAWAGRYPHEFSGGQRQRISIARALMVDPEFIVADEPVSALDVSIQAQILNLLMEAQEKRGLTYMFITHDLSVVEHFSSRVAVMYLGTVSEMAPTKELFDSPMHPYTQALLSAIPELGRQKPKHIKLKGEVPTPIELPSGCVFHGRCLYAKDVCKTDVPGLRKIQPDHWVACHFAGEVGVGDRLSGH